MVFIRILKNLPERRRSTVCLKQTQSTPHIRMFNGKLGILAIFIYVPEWAELGKHGSCEARFSGKDSYYMSKTER